MYSQNQHEIENRQWRILYINSEVISDDTNVEVIVKTRSDKPSAVVPERLYSSLKYMIEVLVSGSFLHKYPLLMAKIQVVNPETNKEIKKNSMPILKGITQGALTQDRSGSKLSMKTKIQFLDVSFHHGKSNFTLQLVFYLPSDLNTPVMIVRSAPFQVFARRPVSSKKRKRVKDSTEEPKAKRPTIKEYMKGLEELIAFKDKFDPETRKKAIQEALNRLVYTSEPPKMMTYHPIPFFPQQPQPVTQYNGADLEQLFSNFSSFDKENLHENLNDDEIEKLLNL